jgi:hypothetical protein
MNDLFSVGCSTGFLDNLYTEGADGLGAFVNTVLS